MLRPLCHGGVSVLEKRVLLTQKHAQGTLGAEYKPWKGELSSPFHFASGEPEGIRLPSDGVVDYSSIQQTSEAWQLSRL